MPLHEQTYRDGASMVAFMLFYKVKRMLCNIQTPKFQERDETGGAVHCVHWRVSRNYHYLSTTQHYTLSKSPPHASRLFNVASFVNITVFDRKLKIVGIAVRNVQLWQRIDRLDDVKNLFGGALALSLFFLFLSFFLKKGRQSPDPEDRRMPCCGPWEVFKNCMC